MKKRASKTRLFPFWFHFVLAGGFAAFVVGLLLARGGGVEARAHSLFEAMANATSPVLNADAMLGRRRTQSAAGSYVLNGMRVTYRTWGAPQGGGRAIIELENQMARAGYIHRILPIQGVPTLVGIHPDTKVMLTARPGRDLRGNPAVRLSEQDLSELREDFQAEIPGVPVYPGATGKTLLTSDDRPNSETLMYSVNGAVDDIRAYYVAEMNAEGWTVLAAPRLPGMVQAGVMFFERDGREASVLLAEIPETAGAMVVVTVGPGPGETGPGVQS